MQRALLNRATMRVADTTEVSGRVTADEVNLDRFHNRIRKVCALVAATLIPSSLRWMLLFTVLIVPQVLWAAPSAPATPQPTPGQTWFATVGAQSNDKGHQALAYLPNEIWINVNDSITWTINVDEPHTVTFLVSPEADARPLFFLAPFKPSPATFDGSKSVSSTGDLASIAKGNKYTVQFLKTGDFKLVCLFHNNMTGVVHVLAAGVPPPHDQAFYDHQAADQQRDLLSDRDGRLVAAGQQSCCAAPDSLITVGVGEISATPGGTSTLSVLRFIKGNITIRVNDTVEWTNRDPVTPHSVTFGPDPSPDPTVPSPSPLPLDAEGVPHVDIYSLSPTDTFSSGLLMATLQDQTFKPQTPLGYTRFRATFHIPGVFSYHCVLHDTLGMIGTVTVH
jgi:plastocyanin